MLAPLPPHFCHHHSHTLQFTAMPARPSFVGGGGGERYGHKDGATQHPSSPHRRVPPPHTKSESFHYIASTHWWGWQTVTSNRISCGAHAALSTPALPDVCCVPTDKNLGGEDSTNSGKKQNILSTYAAFGTDQIWARTSNVRKANERPSCLCSVRPSPQHTAPFLVLYTAVVPVIFSVSVFTRYQIGPESVFLVGIVIPFLYRSPLFSSKGGQISFKRGPLPPFEEKRGQLPPF